MALFIKYIMKKIFLSFLIINLSLISCGGDDTPRAGGTPLPTTPTDPPKTYTDAEITEMVQKDALKYFWDYAQTNSKLARERYHTDNPGQDANVVTTGGSGFGLMTILVGIKNGYVPKADAVSRLTTALQFLQNNQKSTRFFSPFSLITAQCPPRGMPRPRSAIRLRWIWLVPP